MAAVDRVTAVARTERVERNGERARLELRHNPARVTIVPEIAGRPLSGAFVHWCLRHIDTREPLTVQTAALTNQEAGGFIAEGFTVQARLQLLIHDLERPVPVPASATRRISWADRADVLATDLAAFHARAELDELGLDAALRATPSVRWRGVRAPGESNDLAGFAITGRAGRRGYLQRLAVHPEHESSGYATALVLDSLRWCRRWGVRRVVVNTQHDNERALRLYRHLGFVDAPLGLSVLELEIRPDPTSATG